MIENSSNSTPAKTDKHSKSEHIELKTLSSNKGLPSEKFSRSETIKIEKTLILEPESATSERNNEVETIKVERTSKEEKKPIIAKKPWIPTGSSKLTSMIKCNDSSRDKLREQLLEVFSKVPAEASVNERDEVRNNLDEINACDPTRVAATVESVMFEKLGRSNSTLKVKYRSIMFNLKDSKNTDLRCRVLLGHIMLEKLINMTGEEMASDESKLSNKQIQEKALFDCKRGGAPKATTRAANEPSVQQASPDSARLELVYVRSFN